MAMTEKAECIVAQGTFDILHPGHIHYLTEAATFGTELHVIIARRANVTHKPKPVLPDRQRRDVVDALDIVTAAHLGHSEDIFIPIEQLQPDVIVLGHDQHHDIDAVRDALTSRGIECDVVRASARDPRYEEEILSTGTIVDQILTQRGSESDIKTQRTQTGSELDSDVNTDADTRTQTD
ncbi:MAG: cytidyltransferase-related domain protein [Haloquadratum walsbyi J07HQW2]|uniref:FAD synthase n=2 Tax=Haloquadratum walsbyi TaxID=293091 RepID=U1PVY5_9EURY|nr:MAG: cytidyltransferase-related domain protein [Haloquadratum walsbyi J07HQW2]